jgi:hypothetical protein
MFRPPVNKLATISSQPPDKYLALRDAIAIDGALSFP